MKKVILLFMSLVVMLLVIMSTSFFSQADEICRSNVTLIKDSYSFEGFDFKNKKSFSSLPKWIPSHIQTAYQRAQNLPVNSSDSEIKDIFPKQPEESNFTSIKKFVLDSDEAGYQYHFEIKKYKECISSATLNIIAKEKTNTFKTNFFVPTGISKLSKPNENSCQIRRVKNQEILFMKDGVAPKRYNTSINKYAIYLYDLFHSFNYNRDKVYKDIGKADNSFNDEMRWSLIDDEQLQYTVNLKLDQNCEKQLNIQWIDSKGSNYTLSKNNYY